MSIGAIKRHPIFTIIQTHNTEPDLSSRPFVINYPPLNKGTLISFANCIYTDTIEMEKDIFSNLFEVIFVQLECLFGIDNIPPGLTLRRLMSYVYGAPILDVSRSHTTTQHSR